MAGTSVCRMADRLLCSAHKLWATLRSLWCVDLVSHENALLESPVFKTSSHTLNPTAWGKAKGSPRSRVSQAICLHFIAYDMAACDVALQAACDLLVDWTCQLQHCGGVTF